MSSPCIVWRQYLVAADTDRVVGALESISGDRAKAVEWLNHPLALFDGKTPLQLITDGRTENVLRYLQSVESGFVG